MKMNNYLIASLPDIEWEGEIRGTLADFLDAGGFVLESYELLPSLLLYNDLRNLEAIARGITEGAPAAAGSQTIQELRLFCDAPFAQAPAHFPEWLIDFFTRYRDNDERTAHIEEIYTSYFENLTGHPYLEFFSKTVATFRTAVAALRISKLTKPLESLLAGDEESCEIILEHRNSADFGLKTHFAEIVDLQTIFEKSVIERERTLDMLLLSILNSYAEDQLFGDHIIYNYIFSLLIRDRWCGHNEAEGLSFIEKLASA